jgi:dolichol-phosphate mannosyltransferase
MSLTVIIPVKDEESVIENTLESFANSWLKEIDYELLIVDDFSKDNTLKKILDIKKKNPNIKILNNKKSGLGSAISIGIENSTKEFLAIFMADMSDSLIDLKKYYELILQDNKLDAVLGSRFIPGSKVVDYPKFKYLVNRIANNIISLIFISRYNDYTNAFKIYKRSVLLKLFPLVSENFNIFLELPLKIISRKYNYKIIAISWQNRNKGKSKFNLKELGSKYIFTLLYCFFEKILLKKKYD